MTTANTLLKAFLAGLPELVNVTADEGAKLGDLLTSRLQAARAARPAVDLSDEVFASYIASKTNPQDDLFQSLDRLNTTDLYLTCACSQGDPRAISAFDACYLANIKEVLVRLRFSSSMVDEATQQLRQKLLLDSKAGEALITQFAGRGTLRGWVKIAVLRLAYKLFHRNQRSEIALDDLIVEMPSEISDPELHLVRQRYRKEFKIAFRLAWASLSEHMRDLVYKRYLDGMTLEHLGKLFGVHRTTATKWLKDAQKTLYTQTRQEMMARLSIDPWELDSMMRLVESHLDITLSGLSGRSRAAGLGPSMNEDHL